MTEELVKISIDERRERLRAALAQGSREAVVAATLGASPAQLADVLYGMTPEEISGLVRLLGDEQVADIIAELPPPEAADLLLRLSRQLAADILEEMSPDDATDVVEELAPEVAESLLREMPPTEAEEVRELMVYPPDTAGGRMTPHFVALRPEMTADEAIQLLRAKAEEAETIYYAYVTDAAGHLLGVMSLRKLVLAPPTARVGDLMDRAVVSVRADADQEEAARLLNEYHFLALPVVDEQNRLLGIITVDDVAHVLEEEVTEDIARLGGSEPLEQHYLHASVLTLARKRVGWLLVLFLAEAYTGTVLRHFEDELQRVVQLAFFIPLLIGTGGNMGSQTVTTLVRAMAIGQVTFNDLFRVWVKEVATGLLLGLVMGLASFLRALTLQVDFHVGLVVAVAAALICLWAATVAAVLPLLLRRLGIDPAVVSAPFISTLVDGTGLFMYFTVARLMLGL